MFSGRVKAFLFQVLSIPPVLSSVDFGDGNGGGGRAGASTGQEWNKIIAVMMVMMGRARE